MRAFNSGVSFPCSSMVCSTVSRRSSSSRKYSSFSWIIANLDFVEVAGYFLAIACNKGHRGPFIEQPDGGRQAVQRYVELLRDV